jgi:undecaprenyl diphosphate synthase
MFWKKKKEEVVEEEKRPLPKHVAIDLEGVKKWAERENQPISEAYRKSFSIIDELVERQLQLNFPMLTFYVMSAGLRGTEQAAALLEQFTELLNDSGFKEKLIENKVKVTVLGKWYDLPQPVVEAIRRVAEETKDYDSFFVNFCINYDGQEELVDACKLIGRQIKIGKLDADMVTKELLKDNLYSSYFIPPDLIIRNGSEPILSSLLLWDSVGARVLFSKKLFPEISIDGFTEFLTR